METCSLVSPYLTFLVRIGQRSVHYKVDLGGGCQYALNIVNKGPPLWVRAGEGSAASHVWAVTVFVLH